MDKTQDHFAAGGFSITVEFPLLHRLRCGRNKHWMARDHSDTCDVAARVDANHENNQPFNPDIFAERRW